ncbi:MAG: ATP-binding cassette domain-containing protein [Candidatus Pacebacteria bacterium]|nr:ATP-binding cassette domain-containing protein [Candidatus Paceibacterota bacterium]
MTGNESILSFKKVSFEYSGNKPILDEVDFSIRRGTKTTIMGQNGAGKSTIFKLITKENEPEDGVVNIASNLSIAISRQVIPQEELKLTVKEFFEKAMSNCSIKKIYNIDPKIDEVLEAVNFEAPHDKVIGSFSGGQQSRLLLASALIQNPDLLLLDEPTNNLDRAGIEHLTKFLIDYNKTCIVISHDTNLLNSFTDGVLYLDIFTRKIDQYRGNYFDVRDQIIARQEKEKSKNAQLKKEIIENKEKANFFAKKGGNMRLVAKKMREKAQDAEESIVGLKREDKTIHPFVISSQKDIKGEIVNISSFKILKNNKLVQKKTNVEIRRNEHLLLRGPNGIGKSTLLESIAKNEAEGTRIASGVNIGYYRQDFSNLNFKDTVYKSLLMASQKHTEAEMRKIAAGFLITGDVINSKIEELSEGQKGLLSFARLVLQEPGLLILDEPTNHINFRHINVIAEALNKYDGAMIIVSHVSDFIDKIRIDHYLDLEK